MRANSGGGDTTNPAGNVLAAGGTNRVYSTAASNVDMDATSVSAPTNVGAAGGGQPFNNLQPIEVQTACIALEGIFPSRN
jgi:microcystin-dependent protein